MALLQSMPLSPAVRRQSMSVPLRLNISSSMVSSRTCSPLSTLCSPSPLTSSSNSPQHSQRRNSTPVLPTQQSRGFLVQFRRQNQAQLSKGSPAAANLQLTNLPYLVRRTPSNQYPVYLITKAGGTKQQTKVQKTEGDLDALRDDLAVYLGLEAGGPHGQKSPDISINRLNGHIVIKGWRKREILDFLAERNF